MSSTSSYINVQTATNTIFLNYFFKVYNYCDRILILFIIGREIHSSSSSLIAIIIITHTCTFIYLAFFFFFLLLSSSFLSSFFFFFLLSSFFFLRLLLLSSYLILYCNTVIKKYNNKYLYIEIIFNYCIGWDAEKMHRPLPLHTTIKILLPSFYKLNIRHYHIEL